MFCFSSEKMSALKGKNLGENSFILGRPLFQIGVQNNKQEVTLRAVAGQPCSTKSHFASKTF